jgi:hypothetical protein
MGKLLEKYTVCLLDKKGNELLRHNVLALYQRDVKEKAKALRENVRDKKVHRVLVLSVTGRTVYDYAT